jgi:hypothetical protein
MFIDAIRPGVEPHGLGSQDEVALHRIHHLSRVKEMFMKMDVFVFTLGLTETWLDIQSGTCFPTAPGALAGVYDPSKVEFLNASYSDTLNDFYAFRKLLIKARRRDFKVILTVSPVPLTATASNSHVLVATTHSKAILRAAAGHLASADENIDYFPSYEIVTNPRWGGGASFLHNLRSVRPEVVDIVMSHFFGEHPSLSSANFSPEEHQATNTSDSRSRTALDVQCEEMLLEAFSK